MINEFNGKYRFLSNFWLCPIMKGEWVYPSVENAYQASKYPIYPNYRHLFVNRSPAKAKELGKSADLPSNWDGNKIDIMHKLLIQKFRVGSYNAVLLLETGNKEIIEGNSWGDTFWGVCDGVGDNNLGKLIMDVRANLQDMTFKRGETFASY